MIEANQTKNKHKINKNNCEYSIKFNKNYINISFCLNGSNIEINIQIIGLFQLQFILFSIFSYLICF